MPSTFQSPWLNRVEYTFTVNKSGSDAAQVPTSGARVQVHLAGTTTRSATGSPISSGSSGDIEVSHPGLLKVGDVLKNGTAASPTATVNSITIDANLRWKINVTAAGGSFAWAIGDRLVNTSRRPTLYKDIGRRLAWGTNYVDTDADGRIYFYTDSTLVDLLTDSGTGTPAVTAKVVEDVRGGDAGIVLNIRDFGDSIKNALAFGETMPSGGALSIYVPAGVYTYDAADMSIIVSRNCRIFGDGPGCSIIQIEATAGNNNLDLLWLRAPFCVVEGLDLKGRGVSGTGRGIVAGKITSDTISHIVIRNCRIFDWSSQCVFFGQVPAVMDPVDIITIEDCEIGGAQAGAQLFIGGASTMVDIRDSRIDRSGNVNSPSGVYGIHLENCANVQIVNCDGSPSSLTTYYLYAQPTNAFAEPQDGGSNLTIMNCDFESQSGAPTTETTPLVYIHGWNNPLVLNSFFYLFGSGIHFEDCYCPKTINCGFKDLGGSGFTVKITDCINYCDLGSSYELADGETSDGRRQPIVLTTAGTNPGQSMLSNGLMVPRYASDSERDTAPATGIDDKRARTVAGTVIWVDSPTSPTSKLQVYNGTVWKGIGDQAGAAIT